MPLEGEVQRKYDGLQIDEDMKFQRRQWKAERIGWVCMTLFLAAAVMGLFGQGPLSDALAGNDGDPVSVHYDRFPRHGSQASLKIVLGPGAARDGEARVWLSRQYLDAHRLDQVIPEPERVEAAPDRYTYVFKVADAAKETSAVFQLEPDGYGRTTARVGLEGGPAVDVRQFIYP